MNLGFLANEKPTIALVKGCEEKAFSNGINKIPR